MSGTVYLTGVGPGDPGLLTVRAAEVIREAKALVFAPGTPASILDRAPESASRLEMDDRGGILDALIELAGTRSAVVRLYPGDPLLDGGAATESAALRAAGIDVEIIPGIGLAAGAAARVGIALRGPSSDRPTLVLGRWADAAEEEPSIMAVTAAGGTVVALTAADGVDVVAGRLSAVAVRPDLPMAVVGGGAPRRGHLFGTLGELRGGPQNGLPTEDVVVVAGEPVALRDDPRSSTRRPLVGRRVVVTRPRGQAQEFVRGLEQLGAEVLAMPTIRITPPSDPGALREAAAHPDRFDWIVFTSVNGVTCFWSALRAAGLDTRALAGVSLCGIGRATAAAVEMEGARVDLLPDDYVAEAVVAAMAAEGGLAGRRVLLPRAEVAREVLPEGLRALGADVLDVPAYRTVPDTTDAERLRDAFASGSVDLVTFTSSSSVRNFADIVGGSLGGAGTASIGPITSATIREVGWEVAVEAIEHTAAGLVAAIEAHFAAASDA